MAKFKPTPININSESIAITAAPLSLRADDAARLLGTTTFFIEEIMRAGELPFVVFGKRRVIFVADLIAWAQKERTNQLSQQRIGVAA
jgi:excisionase family DNA binding protein